MYSSLHRVEQVFIWVPVLHSRLNCCPHKVCDSRSSSGPIKPKIPLISVLDLATKNLSLSLSLMDVGLQAHIEHGPISEYHVYCPVFRPHIKLTWSVLTHRALGARFSRVCLNLWWMIRFEIIFSTLTLLKQKVMSHCDGCRFTMKDSILKTRWGVALV